MNSENQIPNEGDVLEPLRPPVEPNAQGLPWPRRRRSFSVLRRARYADPRWEWARTPMARKVIATGSVPVISVYAFMTWHLMKGGETGYWYFPAYAAMCIHLFVLNQATFGLFKLKRPDLDELQVTMRSEAYCLAYKLLTIVGLAELALLRFDNEGSTIMAALALFVFVAIVAPSALSCWWLSSTRTDDD